MMKLEAYTEKAILLLGGNLPQVVYLPAKLRKVKLRETTDGTITDAPPLPDEQMERIVEADPVGFLIAIMNGQPVITFDVRAKDDDEHIPLPSRGKMRASGKVSNDGEFAVFAEFHVPSAADRERVAMYLADKVIPRAAVRNAATRKAERVDAGPTPDPAYEAMVANRAQLVDDD